MLQKVFNLTKNQTIFRTIKQNNPAKEHLYKNCFRILNQSEDGSDSEYKLKIKQSKLINAGTGLFLTDGIIKKGDVIALYSGHYFPPPPLWSMACPDGDSAANMRIQHQLPLGAQLEEPEAYQIHCNNHGGYIDGLMFTPLAEQLLHNTTASTSTTSTTTATTTSSTSCVTRPYTSAQLINHPNIGTQPNVYSYSFSWAEYISYIQEHKPECNVDAQLHLIEQVNPLAVDHVWFYDPWTSDTVYIYPKCATVGGLVVIASRDIHIDEELFMDYKYHKNNRPMWYTPVVYTEQQHQE